jgi:hypothetical protein
MSKAYVVVSEYYSPIAIVYPKIRAVFAKRKDANRYAKEKNSRPNSHSYYVVSADLEPNP